MVLSLTTVRYPTPEKRIDYYRDVLERVSAVPGVQQAAFTETMPFTWGIPATFAIVGRSDDESKLPPAFFDSVSPSFFRTMGVSLLAGRTFADTDDARTPRVAVISQSTARKFFPNEDPIGKQLMPPKRGKLEPVPHEIIGIVSDVPRLGLNAPTLYQVYSSMRQASPWFATLLVRSPIPVESLTKSVEREVWAINPEQPITNVWPVKTLVKTSLTQPQLYLALFSLFAVLALVLATLGLYGLIAYGVNQRTREFGIRIALGAQARDLLRLVLGQGVRLALIGIAIGLAGAFAVGRVVEALLFRTKAYDPLVFASVALLLGLVAILAALLPARRATKADPVAALRAE